MSKIEWTNKTWNPIIGCKKKSEGCLHCYAEQFAKRLVNNPNPKIADKYMSVISPNGWTGKTHFEENELEKPFHWKKTAMIFVCSMGDLFHESVKTDDIAKVFAVIFLNPQHIFQILTKRPENAQAVFESKRFKESFHIYCNHLHDRYIKPLEQELYFYNEVMSEWPLKNIWIGVTAENQEQADNRIPILLQIPAKVRFISCEPLLSDINLHSFICEYGDINKPEHRYCNICKPSNKLNWVIAGKETCPGARPMQKEWIQNLYNQCKEANIAFFDKRNELGLNIKNYPI